MDQSRLPAWLRNSGYVIPPVNPSPDTADPTGDVGDTQYAVREMIPRQETYTDNQYRREYPFGSKIIRLDVSKASSVDEQLSFIAHTVFCDNLTNQWVLFPGLDKFIPPFGFVAFHVPAGTQRGNILVLAPNGLAQVAVSGATLVIATYYERELDLPGPFAFSNASVNIGANVGTSPLSVAAYTDRSGTIAAGGTAQNAVAANPARKYLQVSNPGTADFFVNWTTAAVQTQPSIRVPVGTIWEPSVISQELLSIIGPTTGQPYTIKEA